VRWADGGQFSVFHHRNQFCISVPLVDERCQSAVFKDIPALRDAAANTGSRPRHELRGNAPRVSARVSAGNCSPSLLQVVYRQGLNAFRMRSSPWKSR